MKLFRELDGLLAIARFGSFVDRGAILMPRLWSSTSKTEIFSGIGFSLTFVQTT